MKTLFSYSGLAAAFIAGVLYPNQIKNIAFSIFGLLLDWSRGLIAGDPLSWVLFLGLGFLSLVLAVLWLPRWISGSSKS